MADPPAFGSGEARRLLQSVAIFAHLDDAALDGLARLAEPMSLLDDPPRSATLIADEASTLLVLSRRSPGRP